MRKPFAYNVLSNEKCKVCGSKLKMNLIARKENQNDLLCYKCFKFTCSPIARTAREIKNNPSLRSKSREHFPLRRST